MSDINIDFSNNNEDPVIINESFYDWYENNLIVTGFPTVKNVESYNAVINVSEDFSPRVHQYCLEHNKLYFWFPMSECNSNMGLHSIFGALNVLKLCEEQNLKVLLHCQAGVNRSPSVKESYYVMKTFEDFSKEKTPMLLRNIQYGHLPSFYEYKYFLLEIYKNSGIDTCIHKAINHK